MLNQVEACEKSIGEGNAALCDCLLAHPSHHCSVCPRTSSLLLLWLTAQQQQGGGAGMVPKPPGRFPPSSTLPTCSIALEVG